MAWLVRRRISAFGARCRAERARGHRKAVCERRGWKVVTMA
jgi:hypothetical protein